MADDAYAECIEQCLACARACELCADACLGEPDVKMMVECIRLDRDCAAVCLLAAQLMSRSSRFARAFCRLCADVCDECGAECAKHEQGHCCDCAEACRRCAEACRRMAG